jgi:hypothetical protein
MILFITTAVKTSNPTRIKLFGQKSKVWRFVIINGVLIGSCLDSNIVANPKQLMSAVQLM